MHDSHKLVRGAVSLNVMKFNELLFSLVVASCTSYFMTLLVVAGCTSYFMGGMTSTMIKLDHFCWFSVHFIQKGVKNLKSQWKCKYICHDIWIEQRHSQGLPGWVRTEMRKKMKKNWGKIRETKRIWGKIEEMFLSCPSESKTLATALELNGVLSSLVLRIYFQNEELELGFIEDIPTYYQ